MARKTQVMRLDDFTGGMTRGFAPKDFSDRQWARLKGLLLESSGTLRSQWALQSVGTSQDTFHDGLTLHSAFLGSHVVFAVKQYDGAPGPAIYRATLAVEQAHTVSAAEAWTAVTGLKAHPGGTIVGAGRELHCVVPFKDPSGVGYTEGVVVNSRDGTDAGHVIYHNGSTYTAKQYTDRYPNATTDVALPVAGCATMWGDFLVLGDILWLKDEGTMFGSANAVEYPHGMWFSQPGNIESWDLLDTEFITVGGEPGGQIVFMHPVPAGLVVVTVNGPYLLRGTPTSHVMEKLPGPGVPANMYPLGRAATWWAEAGVVAWGGWNDEIWTTNGDETVRVDGPLRTDGNVLDVGAFGPHLVVRVSGSSGIELLTLNLSDDGGAAWTELSSADPFGAPIWNANGAMYGLDGDSAVRRFVDYEPERGQDDGTSVTSTVATRTLEAGDGHDETAWLRASVRYTRNPVTYTGSDADLTTLKFFDRAYRAPSDTPNSTQSTTDESHGGAARRRHAYVQAPGPSVEASIEAIFTGDVIVDGINVWFDGEVPER